MILSLALAYASILAMAVAWGFVELWAKSYDIPDAQRVATAVETAIFVAAAYAVGTLGIALASTPLTATRLLLWIAFLPPLLALFWCVHDLDWRHVYCAAAIGCALSIIGRVELGSLQAIIPMAMASGITGMAMYREQSAVRLRRYTAMLQSCCSCCGYKQKAVRELCSLGNAGQSRVRDYLRANRESRVEDEWLRCRPTSGCS
jgi:hypothetical protein